MMKTDENLRGVIGFSVVRKEGKWKTLAKIIKFFTNGRWSHVFVVVSKDLLFGYFVLETNERRVDIDLFAKYLSEDYEIEIWMPIASSKAINSGLKRIMQMKGKHYGWFQFLGFVPIWLIKKLTGQQVNNLFGSGVICSEEGLEYIKAIGIDKERFGKLDRNSTSPRDLYEAIRSSKYFKKISIKK